MMMMMMMVPVGVNKDVLFLLSGDVLQLLVPVRRVDLLPGSRFALEGLRGRDSTHVHPQGMAHMKSAFLCFKYKFWAFMQFWSQTTPPTKGKKCSRYLSTVGIYWFWLYLDYFTFDNCMKCQNLRRMSILRPKAIPVNILFCQSKTQGNILYYHIWKIKLKTDQNASFISKKESFLSINLSVPCFSFNRLSSMCQKCTVEILLNAYYVLITQPLVK